MNIICNTLIPDLLPMYKPRFVRPCTDAGGSLPGIDWERLEPSSKVYQSVSCTLPAAEVAPGGCPVDWGLLAQWLPRLGPMLCLEQTLCPRAEAGQDSRDGAEVGLTGHAQCLLRDCVRLSSHVLVTTEGPREWLSCYAADGRHCAKLFLLPDADWLAWDEMMAALCLRPECREPAVRAAHWAFLRAALARMGNAWRAQVLCFAVQQTLSLNLLQTRMPSRLSPIGLERAHRIAGDHGTELADTLCTA